MFSTWWISWQADQQQLVRHGSVCVYQCRSIYLIGVWPPKNFLLFPWPATCILFPIFIDKNCCVVVSTERERRTRACLFWQLSRLDGLSCSWTDIVSHGVALNSMQRTTAVCLIATSKLSADSSGTTPWRVFFKCFSLVFCFKSRVASTYLYQHYFYGRKNLFCFIWFCWLNRAPKWVPGVQLKKERNL